MLTIIAWVLQVRAPSYTDCFPRVASDVVLLRNAFKQYMYSKYWSIAIVDTLIN